MTTMTTATKQSNHDINNINKNQVSCLISLRAESLVLLLPLCGLLLVRKQLLLVLAEPGLPEYVDQKDETVDGESVGVTGSYHRYVC